MAISKELFKEPDRFGKRAYCKNCKGYVCFKWGLTGKLWCRICNVEVKVKGHYAMV